MDPRALAIRGVGYCRHPDNPDVDARITRQVFDEAGRLVESWDPRLWMSASRPNLATIHGLSGQSLQTYSVDAGWQLSLLNQAGSLCSFWDARGSQRHIAYDDQQRPIAITELAAEALPRVVERLTYGGSAPVFAVHNQCEKLIRHDNPAGTRFVTDYGLAGSELSENQCFLIDLEPPDWPSELEARDALLEDQSFVTRHVFSPTGEIQRQTDAMGNHRTFAYDVAGKLSETWLLMAGEGRQPQQLVSDIRYNAHDQIESETAGNGVQTRAEYDAENGRLIRLVAAVGNEDPVQDLNYTYDPLGNITELEDKAQAVTWFNNQRIEPINRYRYDSLSQLVEASGWEVANPSHGPALPDLLPTPLDPNQRRNYTQRFEYDAAGNLITRQHSGAPGFSMFTSTRSNRSLAQRDDGSLPGESDIDSGFDACGNQLELQRGQAMTWDIRNQLSRVTLVKRISGSDDYECYAYDRPGHRLRKVHCNQASGRTGRTEVRYLPGLELHRQSDGEERHVISIEAGRCSVRALHWPEGAHADQLRYSLCNHLGSSTLELDHEAGVLTQEHYYAFGGTACWAGKSALVAKYKTIRYSGKERDATGLYYYGYRYYAPWLQRWINPDPAGSIAGINRYQMVKNNPIAFYDAEGLINLSVSERWEVEYQNYKKQMTFSKVAERFKWAGFRGDDRYEFVLSALKHDEGSIRSGRISSKISYYTSDREPAIEDEFHVKYTRYEWSFIRIKRPSRTNNYYLADVVKYQYPKVSLHNDFYGVLPRVIKHAGVVNAETIRQTANMQSGSKEIMDKFLNETENGRSVQKIADLFGLIPWKVERVEQPEIVILGKAYQSPPDFLVHVKPAPVMRRASVRSIALDVNFSFSSASKNMHVDRASGSRVLSDRSTFLGNKRERRHSV
jgi:insecticidal toxin complex protein TccC